MPARPRRSKRLLAFADDARLVEQVRRGSEAAFEVVFERYGGSILGFCRHMLGSTEEAEDAVQHTFAAAYRDLTRDDGREIALKPWLYTIARNRCLSVLRARREQLGKPLEIATVGLSEEVQRRAELRELLADLRELPEDQRAALLLSELGDLSHLEVAEVIGCEAQKVKALVFRARSGLVARRAARETPCEEIREQLANLRGGSLRRTELRHHLAGCPGCSEFREQVKRQRQMLAVALPVVPGLGLKSSVLAAVGIGGGAAAGGGGAAGGVGAGMGSLGAGGGAAAGGAGAGMGGLGAAFASFGSATVAKVAAVGALAASGALAGAVVVDEVREDGGGGGATPAVEPSAGSGSGEIETRSLGGQEVSGERRAGARGEERSAARSRGHSRAGQRGAAPGVERRRDKAKRAVIEKERAAKARGRGPSEAPPTRTPVRRGPPDPRPDPTPKVKRVAPVTPLPEVIEPDPTIETSPDSTTETTPDSTAESAPVSELPGHGRRGS